MHATRPWPLRTRRTAWLIVATVMATALAFAWCQYELNGVYRRFDASSVTPVPTAKFEKIVDRLDKQKEERSQWTYLVLAAVVGVTVLKRVFPIPVLRLAYALLPVAAAFIVQSVRAADFYERHIGVLLLLDTVMPTELMNLRQLVRLQIMFLDRALFTLGIFVALFLGAIITGKIDPATTNVDRE